MTLYNGFPFRTGRVSDLLVPITGSSFGSTHQLTSSLSETEALDHNEVG